MKIILAFTLLPFLLTGQNPIPPGLTLSQIRNCYRNCYQEIRNAVLDSNLVIDCDSLRLIRQNADILFKSGTICFYRPVKGRARMAFFRGEGDFRLTSNQLMEKYQLKRFSGKDTVQVKFKQAWFAFTDDCFEALSAVKKPSSKPLGKKAAAEAAAFRERNRDRFVENIDARLLADAIADDGAGFFQIYLEGPDQNFVFTVDPREKEEISLVRIGKMKHTKRADSETWFGNRPVFASGPPAGNLADISRSDLDVAIDGGERLRVTANVSFTCLTQGRRMFMINLAPDLRVESAVLSDVDTCYFIQEDKDKDAALWVVFPAPLVADREYLLKLVYSGSEVIEDVGGDNYVVQARSVWFPTFYPALTDPAVFHIKYTVPKGLTVLSTGRQIRAWDEGKFSFSEWESGREYVVAGFNYGKFSRAVNKDSTCEIDCYTNTKLSDDLAMIRRIIENDNDLQAELMLLPQELTTERMGKNAAIESGNAYRAFTHFFGPIPVNRIMVSQQPQTGFGQSWPNLIYLPFTAFFDPSVLERLGVFRAATLETDVASHEIAHQWWGHTVFTDSYHDEWLSEGFATYSAALYFQAAKGSPVFRGYMDRLNKIIRARSEKDRPAYELGPIWLGRRLNSLAQPTGYNLIYVKGAYVLHMLRMMLFNFENKSDDRFIAMMKEWVERFSGRIATTRDFNELVNHHFNANMDWFFKQWVYGTGFPVYIWNFELIQRPAGDYVVKLRARQEGVPQDFRMPVPFMINFDDGYAVTELEITGSEPVTKEIVCAKKPKSIEPNIWSSVLCEIRKGD